VVRTTLGAEVDTTVTVSGSESTDFIEQTRSTALSAGASETINVRPPTGKIYELLAFRFRALSPGGAAGDRHILFLRSESKAIAVLAGIASGDKELQYNTSFFQDADDTQRPPTAAAQTAAVKGIRADATNGFQVFYQNDTAVSQTNDRETKLWVREIEVSE